MKKLLVVLALLLALCCVFAACDDKDKSGGEQNEQQTQQGGDQTGGDQTGGDQTGGDQTGGDQTGGDQTGGDQTGGDNTPVHTHAYTVQSTDAKFLASAATCKAAASYYYSCECGEKGNTVFESGGYTMHRMENDVCQKCGREASKGLAFSTNGDGTCRVTSMGSCLDTDLVIPAISPRGDQVTEILLNGYDWDSDRFRYVTHITFPDGAINISDGAFCSSSLKDVYIPSSVRTVSGAFNSSTKLESVHIEDLGAWFAIQTDSDTSFSNILQGAKLLLNGEVLIDITIPSGVTGVREGSFKGYTYLENVTISDGVTSIGDSAFDGCTSLTSITIPASVTSIGDYAFYGCSSLTSVTFVEDSQLASIGNRAFSVCRSLSDIIIPDSVKTIGDMAFYHCASLAAIVIPESVKNIAEGAFYRCSSLASVTFAEGSQLTSIGSSTFYYCSSLTSVNIPASVTSIGTRAFYDCSSLVSVTIPVSVTSIGLYAFSNCFSLASVTFENPNGWWVSTSSSATTGTSVDVSETDIAATYLKDTYRTCYWKRS